MEAVTPAEMTMNRDLRHAVDRWLAEERRGGTAAEDALAGVFRRLPSPPVPAGFVEAVLERSGVGRVPAAAPSVVRWATLAALLLVGVAAAFAPLVLIPLGSLVSVHEGVEAAAAFVLGACRWTIEAMSFWEHLSIAGDAFATVAGKPPLALAAALVVVLGTLALHLLHRLLEARPAPERAPLR